MNYGDCKSSSRIAESFIYHYVMDLSISQWI
ncbi:hypothetical protein swp_0452 [Shewanella piezotolerans WP3]|uniref:Uncharacterized protein n=1 Tax=Shewanella piezotolerans (strain WP3 / JCM 13877) TaxID=225849 RepID=B8CI07_SHEPW|nr:hypothetical protein swp_0452 [Shewanella piezotolerans WP3]